MEPATARALVVDDEPDLCWVLNLMLRPLGLEVITATSGSDALRHAAQQQFELIFIDAILPDTDGLGLAHKLGQINPQAAVVLMSGYYYPEDPAIGASLADEHFVGFLAKPFRIADVRRLAHGALAQQERSHHVADPGC